LTRMRSQGGFTLVEVVVSITILSLVMVALLSALRTMGGTQVAIQGVVDRVDEVRSVSGFLRENLEASVVGGLSEELALGGGATETTYFRVRGDALEWKSRVLFGENYGGSHFLRMAPESGELVLRWKDSRDLPGPGDWRNTPHRVLLGSLDEFHVTIREGFGKEWLALDDYRRIPQLVRLEIKSRGRHWPDLIIPVQR
jgi:general secretion pathway protein J